MFEKYESTKFELKTARCCHQGIDKGLPLAIKETVNIQTEDRYINLKQMFSCHLGPINMDNMGKPLLNFFLFAHHSYSKDEYFCPWEHVQYLHFLVSLKVMQNKTSYLTFGSNYP